MNDKISALCSGARGTLQISATMTKRYNPPFLREALFWSLLWQAWFTQTAPLFSIVSLCCHYYSGVGVLGEIHPLEAVSPVFFFLPASCSIIHRRQINTHSLWFVSSLPRLVYDNNIQRSYAIKLIPLYCVTQAFSSLQCVRKGAPSVGYRTKSMATCEYWWKPAVMTLWLRQ